MPLPARRALAALATLLPTLAAVRPLAAQPQNLRVETNVTFATRDQSIWNAGPATVLEKSYTIGRSWNLSGGFNAIVGDRCDPVFCIDTRTGFALGARTSGSIYFNAAARVNSGSLDGDVATRAILDVYRPSANPVAGDVISVKGALDDPRVTFATEGPSVEARAGISGSLYVGMSGTGCFIGFGCKSSSSTLVNLPRFDQEIASYNWNESGVLKLLGRELPGFNFGEPIDLPIPGASFTLFTPDLDVDGAAGRYRASGTATTDVARLDLDPLQLGLAIALPGSECLLACSLNLGAFSVDYTLFSATLGAVVGLKQDLMLSLAHPFTRYDFNMPTRVRQNGVWSDPVTWVQVDGWAGGIEVEYATGLWGIPLAVTPTYGFGATLRNNTYLTVSPSVTVDVLEGSAAGYSFGPVYSNEWRLPGMTIPVFNTTFDVPFGSWTGQMVALGQWPVAETPGAGGGGGGGGGQPGDGWSNVAAVPEPATVALLGTALGLLGLASLRRTRGGARR